MRHAEKQMVGVSEQASRHAPAFRLGPQEGRNPQRSHASSAWLERPEYSLRSNAFPQRACANAQHRRSLVWAIKEAFATHSKRLQSRPGALGKPALPNGSKFRLVHCTPIWGICSVKSSKIRVEAIRQVSPPHELARLRSRATLNRIFT
jgi:hypothetical protein